MKISSTTQFHLYTNLTRFAISSEFIDQLQNNISFTSFNHILQINIPSNISYTFYSLRNVLALAGRGKADNSGNWQNVVSRWHWTLLDDLMLSACVRVSYNAADTTIITRVNVSKDQFYGLRHSYGRRAVPRSRTLDFYQVHRVHSTVIDAQWPFHYSLCG